MTISKPTSRAFRAVLAMALLWIVVVGVLTFQLWPYLPSSKTNWLLFVVLGPVLYLLGEAFFGWFFSYERGQSISPGRFSFKRILVALPIALAFIAFVWWLLLRLGSS